MVQNYDIVIVGAGIFGCPAAVTLAKDNRKVLLIERDWSEPDRIVGELLQPGGVVALKNLGLDHCLSGIDGIKNKGYVVINGEDSQVINYPSDKGVNQGIAFHHGKFIMKLRKAALLQKNVIKMEGTVISLITEEESNKVIGVSVSRKTEDGESVLQNIYAPLTIVADGCFSKFRPEILHPNKEKASIIKSSTFVGFVLKDCQLPRNGYGHVILGKPSPVLLYRIGTRDTRILVDIPGEVPSVTNGDLKNYLQTQVGPQLPKKVQKTFYQALQTERLRTMPNQFLPASPNKRHGVIAVGDAMNMRHPLTGGGMTVAFWDVIHLHAVINSKIVPDLNDTDLVVKQMKKFHWLRKKGVSSVINILANALYTLFSAQEGYLLILQKACFAYFKLGGNCILTPAGLLAGLLPEPLTLLYHFFVVAFYGCYLTIANDHWYMIPINFLKCFMILGAACYVILPIMLTEVTRF